MKIVNFTAGISIGLHSFPQNSIIVSRIGNNNVRVASVGFPNTVIEEPYFNFKNSLGEDYVSREAVITDLLNAFVVPGGGGGGGSSWGLITGTLSDQTDLQTALNAKLSNVLADANILVGNGSNIATAVSVTGDVSINNLGVTSIASSVVTGKVLTGLATGANTQILATDSILVALQNLQAQISAGAGGTTGSGTSNFGVKWTGTTTLGNSLYQDDGTNTSIGVAPVSSQRLTVLSAGATSATFIARFHNSTGTNNSLVLRSDGFNSMGSAVVTSTRFNIQSSGASSTTFALKLDNSTPSPIAYFRSDRRIAFGTSTFAASTAYTFDANTVANGIEINNFSSLGLTIISSVDTIEGIYVEVGGDSAIASHLVTTGINETALKIELAGSGSTGVGIQLDNITGTWDSLKFTSGGANYFVINQASQIVYRDGTQGLGKFLTGDANGLASWATVPAGTVTSFIFTNGSGFVGSVTSATTTPTLALTVSTTQNYILKTGASGAISDSLLYDSGAAIGINTNLPNSLLDVVGVGNSRISNFRAGSVGTGYLFQEFNNTGGSFGIGVNNSAGGALATNSLPYATLIFSSTSTAIQFAPVQSVAMTITTGRNIGIGETAPSARIHVVGAGTSSASNTALFHNSTGTSNSFIIRDDGFSSFGTTPVTNSRVSITSSGATSASWALQLRSSTSPLFYSRSDGAFGLNTATPLAGTMITTNATGFVIGNYITGFTGVGFGSVSNDASSILFYGIASADDSFGYSFESTALNSNAIKSRQFTGTAIDIFSTGSLSADETRNLVSFTREFDLGGGNDVTGSLLYIHDNPQSSASSGHIVQVVRKTSDVFVINTDGDISVGNWNGTIIAGSFGGTGFGTYAVGDLLYANTTSSLAKRAAVATGSVLVSAGVSTAPVWSTTLPTAIDTLYILKDGTRALTGNWAAGAFSATFNSVIVGSAANVISMGSASGASSTISSTTNATKGTITIGAIASIDEANLRFRIGTATTADANADSLFSASATNKTILTLQGKLGQADSWLEFQDSTGSVLGAFNSAGNLAIGSIGSATDALFIQKTFTADTGLFNNAIGVNVISSQTSGFAILTALNLTATQASGAATVPVCTTLIMGAVAASAGNFLTGLFVGAQFGVSSTAAQTGTIADAFIFNLVSPVYTGSKPTANIGINIQNQGHSGVTLSAAISIAAQSGSTANFGILSAANILINSPTVGLGYTTGSGGAVTQATSKSTGVTLNTISGQITMNNATLNAGTSVSFTLTNSNITANDVALVTFKSGNTANSYTVMTDSTGSGSCTISLRNYTGGNLGEAVVLNYVIIKGVSS